MLFCFCIFQKLKYEGEEIDDDLEDSYYLRRLEAGLFTLQLLDYIMLEICATGPSSVSQDMVMIYVFFLCFVSVVSIQCKNSCIINYGG